VASPLNGATTAPVVAELPPSVEKRGKSGLIWCTIGNEGVVVACEWRDGPAKRPPRPDLREAPLRLLVHPAPLADGKRSGAVLLARWWSHATVLRRVRIFSGIQPTGRKHLGNYIGAIRQYVASQERGEGIFCIVDLHATTVPYDPATLRERVHDTAAILLAAGLDPERCILFRQGDVQEHTELCWLLSSVTALGELNRMHQFRDKSLAQRELVSAGLLFYPVLQAADVLAYRADEVPVGEDQREHLELMREIARRFNARFGGGEEILVPPATRIPEIGGRIMDLQDPARKMSTTGATEEGTVYVLDEPAAVTKKLRRAVTDSGTEIRRGPDKPGVTNLIDLLAAVRDATPEQVEADLARARGYGDLKAAVAEAVVALLAPVRERYAELRGDEQQLEAVLAAGAQKARGIASGTLRDVRGAMGVGPPA
jgi:tryptophanyl-tRNA synthetase